MDGKDGNAGHHVRRGYINQVGRSWGKILMVNRQEMSQDGLFHYQQMAELLPLGPSLMMTMVRTQVM